MSIDLAPVDGMSELFAFDVRLNPDATQISLKLERGAAVWNTRDGSLVFYEPNVAHVSWLLDGRMLFLENRFGRCSSGVLHSASIRSPDGNALFEVPICIPWGGVEIGVVSPVSNLSVVFWREQADWGYVGLDVDQRRQTTLSARWTRGGRGGPPVFTPGGEAIVSCHSTGPAWWNSGGGDDPASIPSEGGRYQIAYLATHDVGSGTESETPVFADVVKGWLPKDPFDSLWYQVWGPEFVASDECRFWLPDGRSEKTGWPLSSDGLVFKITARVREEWAWRLGGE